MVFDMTDPYCTLVLRGIENTLYQSSYLPILTDVHNERSRFERYLEMLLDRRIEGLIVLANWLFLDINLLGRPGEEQHSHRDDRLRTEDGLDQFRHRGQRSRRLSGPRASVHSLGHRKIAFIRGPKTLTDSSPRWRGIRNCAKTCGLELDPRLIVDLPESRDPISSFEAGYKLTEELVKQKRPFTALLAFDDMTAFGAIRALAKAGIRVPEQCSVIGFDDVATSALYTPSLTTVRQPMEAMGAIGGGHRGRWNQRSTRKAGSRSDAPQGGPRIGGARVHAQRFVGCRWPRAQISGSVFVVTQNDFVGNLASEVTVASLFS